MEQMGGSTEVGLVTNQRAVGPTVEIWVEKMSSIRCIPVLCCGRYLVELRGVGDRKGTRNARQFGELSLAGGGCGVTS